MEYKNIIKAEFVSRPNRFIAHCLVKGEPVTAHVKNTGRCRELLVPGATVYLEHSSNPKRKTQYSLIAVEKGSRLINMDSQAPNSIAAQGIEQGVIRLPLEPGESIRQIKREVTYGESRFDLQVLTTRRAFFVEIKGVTLEEEGAALFPDAPTQRGVKHMHHLIQAMEEGYSCCILFIIQMESIAYFSPNYKTHREFGEALAQAQEKGVAVLAYDCHIAPGRVEAKGPVEVCL